MKRVVVRARADEDVDRALGHCAEHHPERLEAFVKALEATFRRTARLPSIGSPRFALLLDIEGLRVLPTPRFPYLVFYVEGPREILIVRVLHQKRDVPAMLLDPPDDSDE